MIGALWTGISGLSSQQQALDNESNNIANVNTVGFKSSRISFADQMYQDKIGKGSKILDSEKLYVQGNLKLTGVSYDMALSGEGFFTVANSKSSGTSELLYTRAGNFRMGDNGTLQDAAGNEVQGWMMSPIDAQKDVTSTNPNATVFTNDYSQLLSSKIIRHGTYIDTITAKASDYNQSAKADSETIFSGSGLKTKSAKISDIEAAIADYSNWLQKLKEEPDGASSTSIPQISQVNFKTGSEGLVSKDGEQIYVYINGNKISQNFVPTAASADQMQELYDYDQTLPAAEQYGFADPTGTLTESEQALYDTAMGRIETYKALANKISETPGLKAYMVAETNLTPGGEDVFDESDIFKESTKITDMLYGIMEIKSLIPGIEFTLSEAAEVSGNNVVQANYQTSTIAQAGEGLGALESSRDALSRLITGNQRDVFTTTDLNLTQSPAFNVGITIYDKELGENIPVPNDGGTPPNLIPLFIDATDSNGDFTVDEFVKKFNELGATTSPVLTNYIEAVNINGALVLQTLDSNYDVEFSTSLKQLPTYNINLNEVVDNSIYNFNLDINGSTYPIIIDYSTLNSLNQETAYEDIRNQIETEVNNINILNPNYELFVTQQSNGLFSIYSKNEDISFENSITSISDNIPIITTSLINAGVETTLDDTKLTVPFQVDMNSILSSEIFGSEVTWVQNPDGTYTSSGVVDLSGITKKLLDLDSSYIKNIEFTFDHFGATNEYFTLKDGSITVAEITGSGYTGNENVTTPLDISYVDSWDYSNLESSGEGTVKLNDIKQNVSVYATGAILSLDKMVVTLQSSALTNAPQTPTTPPPYNFTIKDTTNSTTLADINYVPTSSQLTDPALFYAGILDEIKNTQAYKDGLISATSDETGVNILNHNLVFSSSDNSVDFGTTQGLDGVAKEVQYTINTGVDKSKSVFKLTINDKVFTYKTVETPTSDEIRNYFISQLQADTTLNELVEISGIGDNIIVRNKDTLANGFQNFTSNFTNSSITASNDGLPTVAVSSSTLTTIDKNNNYSGRTGAGAEFIEIINKVNQTASKGSLQLRLDTLGISDSAFGEFSVDSTGLITMKQDGAEFAIGQVAIALFNNNRALEPAGDNLLKKTTESGEPIYNLNNDKTAKIEGKTLELSTADLSESLVNLMVFQRAFEANAKSITTSDELLNTLINLKR